jgi:hypothetical protein
VLRAAWRATAVAVVLFAIVFSLQAKWAVFTRPFTSVAPRFDINWQFQDWPALAEAWPGLESPEAVVVDNWVTGAKVGHALGPRVAVVPLSDPRHFQYLDTGHPPRFVAVHPVPAGQAEEMSAAFKRTLRKRGFDLVGPSRVIPQRTGDYLRFEIVTIPVTRQK